MYWLGRYLDPVTLTYILRSSDFEHFASTFDISSTIRPTTIKPCKVLLLNVLTQQIPWPGDLDLYFGCSDFDIIYVNIQDLLKCKTSSHQTLHSASPQCTDSTGTLTGWPWPIFCAPLTFTPFTSPFHMSSTTKSYIVLLLDVLTRQVPWPIFCTPVTLTHFMLMFGISSNIRATTTKPCIVLHLIALAWQVPWPSDLDLYLTHFTLMFDNLEGMALAWNICAPLGTLSSFFSTQFSN